MPSVTRDAVIAMVRARGEYSDSRVTDPVIEAEFERARQELHALLCLLNHEHGLSYDTLTLTSEHETLPTGWLYVRSVAVADTRSLSGYTRIGSVSVEQRDMLQTTSIHDPSDYLYTVIGDELYLAPEPPSGTEVRVGYQGELPALAGGATAFQVLPSALDWLVAELCVACGTIENEDTSQHEAKRAAAEGKLAALFSRRDLAGPRRVHPQTERRRRGYRQRGDFA